MRRRRCSGSTIPLHRNRRPRLDGDTECDLAVVGAGFTGLWSALLAKQRARRRSTSWCSKHGALPQPPPDATAASATPASRTDSPTDSAVSPTSSTRSTASASRTSTPSRRPSPTHRHRLRRSSAPACSTSRPRRGSSTSSPSSRRRCANTVTRSMCSTPTAHARRGGVALVSRRACGCTAGRRSSTLRGSRGACARACIDAGVRIHDGTAGASAPRRSGSQSVSTTATRQRHRATGGARDQRRSSAARAAPTVHSSRLRLRARHRAADRHAARLDRLETPPGNRRQRQPVPLLPAHRGLTHPLGRLRRHLSLTAIASRRSSSSARRRSTSSPGISSRRSRSSRACASRTAGAAPSTRAAASAPSGERATAVALPMRSATRDSASAPRDSARR